MDRILRWQMLTVCAGLLTTSLVWAENWPGWRGPRGDGSSVEQGIPTRWNGETGENIVWKTAVPGVGHASPIVWEDRIFTVSCLLESRERILLCFDRRTGGQLWQQTVLTSPLETKHHLNSHASGTPATDGRWVYVTFLEVQGDTIEARNVSQPRPVTAGRMVVAAYDFEGNQQWLVRPGEFVSVHGYCSCPVLFEDLVIVNGDHDGDSYLVALDKTTGQTVWKVDRQYNTRSYVTPLIREIEGRIQMVLSGSHHIASYDPRSGSMHWQVDGPTEQFVASLVFDGRLFYMAAGFPTYHVMAVRPDGEGNVTDSHVVWHSKDAACYVPSPVVLDGRLFVADDRGTVNCFRATDGRRLWRERMAKHISASLVTAGGLVYFLSDDGIATLVRPADEMEVVAENPLGEYCFASPAISQGQIFLRAENHLYCIGVSETPAAAPGN
jgi:outer membrane protein assembly factor BamB